MLLPGLIKTNKHLAVCLSSASIWFKVTYGIESISGLWTLAHLNTSQYCCSKQVNFCKIALSFTWEITEFIYLVCLSLSLENLLPSIWNTEVTDFQTYCQSPPCLLCGGFFGFSCGIFFLTHPYCTSNLIAKGSILGKYFFGFSKT